MIQQWRQCKTLDMQDFWSKVALERGDVPLFAWESEDYQALYYEEKGKMCRYMIRRKDKQEIKLTWTELAELLRPITMDRCVVEVFPPSGQIINTANHRHFWLIPTGILPRVMNLRG